MPVREKKNNLGLYIVEGLISVRDHGYCDPHLRGQLDGCGGNLRCKSSLRAVAMDCSAFRTATCGTPSIDTCTSQAVLTDLDYKMTLLGE